MAGFAGSRRPLASAELTANFAHAILARRGMAGVSLDYSACFDNIDAELAVEVMQRCGLPQLICT